MSTLIQTVAAARRRRRASSHEPDAGFTLIELLVVVIIIGILAAIAIPVYLGIQSNAKDSAVQSDLTNFKTAAVQIQGGTNTPLAASKTTYATLTTALSNAGASQSPFTTSFTYYPATSGYCILALSKTGNSYAATDTAGVQKGSCTTAGAYSTTVVTTAP